MSRRCPNARFVQRMDLKGWQLHFGAHATIVPKRGAVVPGALWQVDLIDFYALDRYEGYPIYYTRRRWRQDNQHFFFYEMTTPAVGDPSVNYVQGIVQGYQDCGITEDHWHQKLRPYLKESVYYNHE
jgi:gamma-glutamylcyclotransferase (GGCT)/AIG2-like uncharacterized protein YtfP